MTDIMIDLETLSTRADAAIISIGAVAFDIKTGEVTDTFYKTVGLFDQKNYGHIDPATVRWWLQQSDEAREEIASIDEHQYLYIALNHVREFIRRNKTDTTRLWSNGSSFDLVILRNAFQRHQMNVIWDYWLERDVRTIVDLAGVDVKQTTPNDHIEHHALGDALFQVAYVSEAYRVLKGMGSQTA